MGLYSSKPKSFKNLRSVANTVKEEFEAEMNGAVIMGDDFNRVFLDPDRMDRDGTKTGITSSFTIMHELGH